jgi:hypothetical protein
MICAVLAVGRTSIPFISEGIISPWLRDVCPDVPSRDELKPDEVNTANAPKTDSC